MLIPLLAVEPIEGWLRRAKDGAGTVGKADLELVEAIRSGDPSAFEGLYRSYFRRVHAYAMRKLGDAAEAEDVTQEAFEAVLTGIGRFEGRSRLSVWVYGIARNLVNNRLRRRGGHRLVSLDDLPSELAPTDPGPEAQAEARQSCARIQGAIESLPADQRRIFELRHERRLAIRKIAAIMERSEDAVKSSLYRTRRTLAASLPGEPSAPSI